MKRITFVLSVAMLALMIAQDAFSLPSWSRRYGISCEGCHANRINRMNQTGLNMYRMGFRTAHSDKETNNIGDYLNIMAQVDAGGRKGNLTPTYSSLLRTYVGGALSERFSFLTEATTAPASEQELADIYLQYTSQGDNYMTVRFGQFLPLIMVDNPVEIAADRGAPFPRERRFGAEVGFSQADKFWGAFGLVESSDPNGIGKKDLYDVVVNGQIIGDEMGSSLGGFAWLGRYHTSRTNLDAKDDYSRFGLIGNYNTSSWLLSGGFVTGKGSSSEGGAATTTGLYANFDYFVTDKIVPIVNITWFDPNTDVNDNEQLIVTASLFWWADDHVSFRPQIVYAKDKGKGANYDTYRFALRAQFIY